ncbi:MAG: hypothetical protein ACREEL_01310 [Stellaceae bacterium]
MSIGLDHIDLAAAKARNIRVTNTPDVLTDDVADLAIGLMIAVARRLMVADRYVRAGASGSQGRCRSRASSAARHWASWAWGASAKRSPSAPWP